MSLLICPGFHQPELTKNFITGLQIEGNCLIFPIERYAPISTIDILTFLQKHEGNPERAEGVIFISYSAGVVGAIGAAIAWQLRGGKVKAFFAIDGWGVPKLGEFPFYRLSHDSFTHWSSGVLGLGKENFYADRAVEHLQLWISPQTTLGWWVKARGCKMRCSAAEFIKILLSRHGYINSRSR